MNEWLRRTAVLAGAVVSVVTVTCLLSACGEKEEEVERSLGFEAFVPKYNAYIKNWLTGEHARVQKEYDVLKAKVDQSAGIEKKTLESDLEDVHRELERITFRQSLGDYFAFKKEEDIPEGLEWDDGMDEPEIGDPRALKGGAFHHYVSQFPATVRPFGRESNNSFRGVLYDNLEIALVGLHPLTMKLIPGTAKRWAVSKDGRTVYYELDPDARYNDGHKIDVKDYMVGVYLRVSDNISAPFEKQYFRAQLAQIASYGQKYLSVSLPEQKPLMPMYGSLSPAPAYFYKDYGPDYVDRYQWKVPPSTGPYFVRDKDIVKGVSITLTRDKNWWAKDKKYYRYRFNPDKMIYTVIRDESKSFELFRAGQLDAFWLTRPNLWYQKSEIEPVFNGYIERYKFYNQFPRSPRGVFMNLARPKLKDLNLRKGVAYALNWQKCIDVIFRGDYTRAQQFSEGFGEITNPHVKARPFSVTKAREYFRKAGYTQESGDGILRTPAGDRLAINLSYANVAYYPRLVAVLKEEAKKAGLELRADGLEPTVFYKKVMKKKHEMCIWAWGTAPPFPRYYQSFSSKNAFDSNGQPKPQTNNINSYANPLMDKYCKAVRYARTVQEVKDNAWKIQQMIHDEALFSPGWVTNFARIGTWRWVRWPDTKDTPFCVPVVYEPLESYAYWIDEDIKEETLEAMRSGKTYPEVQKVIDVFKDGIPQQKEDAREEKEAEENEKSSRQKGDLES
jgi:microcin C transport system substrate-binding protein